MALLPNQRLGPYEILSAIGAGGMGEVYRARDTRLERIVAVKILPDHLANRAELRERFEREARTVASLNHPHICTLHDIGQQEGADFLVMEYLEGETLAERLKKGPLPFDQVLQYAIEISDALDKAHRKGITHRDLKPSNIMLTKSGTKLLDVGLAKLREPQTAVANLPALPTEGSGLTALGTIVGTLQYIVIYFSGHGSSSRTSLTSCRKDGSPSPLIPSSSSSSKKILRPIRTTENTESNLRSALVRGLEAVGFTTLRMCAKSDWHCGYWKRDCAPRSLGTF